MDASVCRTLAQRDVLDTYRRFRRRKNMTDFRATDLALKYEIDVEGARLSIDFVEQFSEGTHTFDDNFKLTLTKQGRDLLMSMIEEVSPGETQEGTNQ